MNANSSVLFAMGFNVEDITICIRMEKTVFRYQQYLILLLLKQFSYTILHQAKSKQDKTPDIYSTHWQW